MSKYIAHQVVKGLVSKGLAATMVLPGLPFGPGDRAPTPTGSVILQVLQGKAKNWWKGGVCLVDVRDVARRPPNGTLVEDNRQGTDDDLQEHCVYPAGEFRRLEQGC